MNKIAELVGQMIVSRKNLINGCVEIVMLYRRLPVSAQESMFDLFKGFIAIESETDHFPRGEARKRWNNNALEQKDTEMAKFESFFEGQILEDCHKLLSVIGKNNV